MRDPCIKVVLTGEPALKKDFLKLDPSYSQSIKPSIAADFTLSALNADTNKNDQAKKQLAQLQNWDVVYSVIHPYPSITQNYYSGAVAVVYFDGDHDRNDNLFAQLKAHAPADASIIRVSQPNVTNAYQVSLTTVVQGQNFEGSQTISSGRDDMLRYVKSTVNVAVLSHTNKMGGMQGFEAPVAALAVPSVVKIERKHESKSTDGMLSKFVRFISNIFSASKKSQQEAISGPGLFNTPRKEAEKEAVLLSQPVDGVVCARQESNL